MAPRESVSQVATSWGKSGARPDACLGLDAPEIALHYEISKNLVAVGRPAAVVTCCASDGVWDPEKGFVEWFTVVDDEPSGEVPAVAESADGHEVEPVSFRVTRFEERVRDRALVQFVRASA